MKPCYTKIELLISNKEELQQVADFLNKYEGLIDFNGLICIPVRLEK